MSNNKKVSDNETLLTFLKNNLLSLIKRNALLKMQLKEPEIKDDLKKQSSHLEKIHELI